MQGTHSSRLALSSLVALGALLAAPAVASACTEAIEYEVTVEQSDLPECATLDAGESVGEAYVTFGNNCTGELHIEAVDCDGCQQPLTLRPGADSREFLLESGPQTSSPRLSWTLQGMSGEILLNVEIVNSSDDEETACGGCRLGGAPGSGAGLLALLLALGWTGRRRR